MSNSPVADDFGLDELLEPLSPSVFFERFWEKAMCHVTERGVDYYRSLFSIGDVELIMAPFALSESLIRVVNSHDHPEPSGDVYRRYIDGNTVNINFIHRQSRPINFLCKRLEAVFHCPVSANLYLTPPQSQGFRIHYDNHDVFVLQLHGSKTWELWNPEYLLPLSDCTRSMPDNLGTPQQTVRLTPGQLLYVPRGFVHQAYTENSSSLHVTVGVSVVTLLDLLISAIKTVAEDNIELRRSLSLGFFHGDEPGDVTRAKLKVVFDAMGDHANIEKAIHNLGLSVLKRLDPALDRRFETLDAIDELESTSVLGKRLGTIALLQKHGEYVALYFGSSHLQLPITSFRALQFMIESEVFPVAAIPDLDGASQLTLVRLLVKEGFLTVLG